MSVGLTARQLGQCLLGIGVADFLVLGSAHLVAVGPPVPDVKGVVAIFASWFVSTLAAPAVGWASSGSRRRTAVPPLVAASAFVLASVVALVGDRSLVSWMLVVIASALTVFHLVLLSLVLHLAARDDVTDQTLGRLALALFAVTAVLAFFALRR